MIAEDSHVCHISQAFAIVCIEVPLEFSAYSYSAWQCSFFGVTIRSPQGRIVMFTLWKLRKLQVSGFAGNWVS